MALPDLVMPGEYTARVVLKFMLLSEAASELTLPGRRA